MPGGTAGPAGIAHCSSIVRMIMKDCHDESKAKSKLCQVGGKFIHQAISFNEMACTDIEPISLPCVYPPITDYAAR